MSSQRLGNPCSAAITDLFECVEHGLCKIGDRTRDTAEHDNHLLIGNRNQRLNDFGRGLMVELAHQHWAGFDPTETAESNGGGDCNLTIEIVEQFRQQRQMGPGRTNAPAGCGANCRIGIPEQWGQAQRRDGRPELGGDAQRENQGRTLHHLIEHKPSNGLPRRLASDLRQCLECRRLLGDQAIGAETGQSPAEPFKRRDRPAEAAATCFRC